MSNMKPHQKESPPSKTWTAASIHFLTQSEMRALLDVIRSKRDYAIFLVAYRHGLRASEIGMLRREDLDLKQYRIRIHRLKNSRLMCSHRARCGMMAP